VKTGTIFKGVTPFWIVDIVRLALLLLVPWFALVLPTWFYHCDPAKGFPYTLTCPAKPPEKSRLTPKTKPLKIGGRYEINKPASDATALLPTSSAAWS
jgi:hypothetical protein